MLFLQKWEKDCLESQPQLQIINTPRPCQQPAKILKNLQTSCNSPIKATQIKALQCWATWIKNRAPDEWKVRTTCNFAVKPLMTKKLHPLHKDADVCKLKLNIMWDLLIMVQTNMELDGPQHVLETFLQSCFMWLASIDSIDNAIPALILRLLLNLFKKDKKAVKSGNHVFSLLGIDLTNYKNLVQNYYDKFLNIFDNWKKFQKKDLILNLWKYFLEHCELSHESITTLTWHRIFNVNQIFCSDSSLTVKERLEFLHVAATTIKTVLPCSKYIGSSGGTCFMTPCEALMKKLVDISVVHCEESFDAEMFVMCEDISKELSFKSIPICDFDLCIYLVDALEDFSLKSLFWGAWCGLVDCYKNTIQGTRRIGLSKKAMKFYRKLRAIAVNLELDIEYLNNNIVAMVQQNTRELRVGCICAYVKVGSPTGSVETPADVEMTVEEGHKNWESHELVLVPRNSQVCDSPWSVFKGNFQEGLTPRIPKNHLLNNSKFPFNMKPQVPELDREIVAFGSNGSENWLRLLKNGAVKAQNSILPNSNFVQNILSTSYLNLSKILLESFYILRIFNMKSNNRSVLLLEDIEETTDKTIVPLTQSYGKTAGEVVMEPVVVKAETMTHKRRKNSRGEDQCNVPNLGELIEEELSLALRTRSWRKAAEAENKKLSERTQNRKKRKSFEDLVQEIVNKNKLRKTEKNSRIEKIAPINTRVLRKKCGQTDERRTKKCVKREILKRKANPKKQKKKDEEKPSKITDDNKLENFFKVIKPQVKEKKDNKLSGSGKVKLEKTQHKRGRAKKNEVNWKQTSLKALIKVRGEKETQGIQKRKVLAKEKATVIGNLKKEEATKSNFINKTLRDHEYARPVDASPSLIRKTNAGYILKKRTNKLQDKMADTGRTDLGMKITEVVSYEPSTQKENRDKNEEHCVEDQKNLNKALETITSSAFAVKSENCALEESVIDSPSVTETELARATETKNNEEETVQLIAQPEKAQLTQDEKNPKIEMEEIVQPSSATSGKERNEGSSSTQSEVLVSDKSEEFVTVGIKRTISMDTGRLHKKIKLYDHCDDSVTDVEKENMDATPQREEGELFSPLKTNRLDNSLPNSPKTKSDSCSPDNHKSAMTLQRTASSRALKMLALVPESNSQSQQSASSPRLDMKPQSKKYVSVDKSSRVSKMLASLYKNSTREVEDLVKVESTGDSPISSSSNNNAKTFHVVSSKPAKKKKFISFDDSKTETIVYQVDSPPCKIQEQRRKLKDNESPEVMIV